VKLYVGNLPFTTSSDDLSRMFAPHGAVESAEVVTDRDTGRSRGFGFVEMGDEDARRAIEELDGSDIGGRRLTVNEARPRQPRGGGGDRGGDRDRGPRRDGGGYRR
jgi:RNA recognition motif-containing protein